MAVDMLNQVMEPTEIMDLYFTKYDTYQNLWLIYIVILLGLLVYISGKPKSMIPGVRKVTLLGCVGLFALVNLFAILKNKSDIENLKSASTVSLVAHDQAMVNVYLQHVLDNSLGILDWVHNHWEVVLLHLGLDLVVILLMTLMMIGDRGELRSV